MTVSLIRLMYLRVILRCSCVLGNGAVKRLIGSNRQKRDLVQSAKGTVAKKHQAHQENGQKLSRRSGQSFSNGKETTHSQQPNTKSPVGVQEDACVGS